GFLGLEVLGRRDRSGFCELGDRCHARGVNHPRRQVSIGGKASFRHVSFRRFAGERNTCSQTLRTEPVDRSAATSGKFLRDSQGGGNACASLSPSSAQSGLATGRGLWNEHRRSRGSDPKGV